MADFLGVSNLMDAVGLRTRGGRCKVQFGDFELIASQGEPDAHGEVKLSIRPERVDLEASGTTGPNRIPGMVERIVYVGSTMQVIVHLAPGDTLQALIHNEGETLPFQQGTAVAVHLPRQGGGCAAGRGRHEEILRPPAGGPDRLRSRNGRSPRRPSAPCPVPR